MAYSELIKNFEPIRDYMRQFYVYGFKSRSEYQQKSARSYDNERRRMESWLGDYMSFRQTAEGKNVFLSVDSRAIPANPLYHAFKARSFTDGDVIFHFYILDLLADGEYLTAQEILDRFCEDYLSFFDAFWQPDISTIRKKLKEYVSLGLLDNRKQGRELRFGRREEEIDLSGWVDAAAYFSETNPLGVVGSFLLDKLEGMPDYFRFKHHYILHALDSQILLQILTAMGEKRRIEVTNINVWGSAETEHRVYPLKILISTQGGRQYLLCYHYHFKKLMTLRLDHIHAVKPGEPEKEFLRYEQMADAFRKNLWGASTGSGSADATEHLEMTLSFGHWETFIPQRLEREKRCGQVEMLDARTCRYTADVFDARELLPWLRTFIGRIEDLSCSNPAVVEQFYADLERMDVLYGGDWDAVQ